MSEQIKLAGIIEPATFYKQIDDIVSNLNISHLDAIVHYCDINKVEIETVASLVKSNNRLKSSLLNDGEQLNFFPKRAKLPL